MVGFLLLVAQATALVALSRTLAWESGLERAWPEQYWTAVAGLWVANGLCLLALGGHWALRRSDRTLRLYPQIRAALWVPTLVMVLCWTFLQPYRAILVEIALGWGAGSFALVVLILWGALRSRLRRPTRWLDFLLTTTSVTLIFVEVGTRNLSHFSTSQLLRRGVDVGADNVRAHRYPPRTLHLGFPTNSRGDYSPEVRTPSEEKLVVFLGDSFSIGTVPLPLHFTQVCDQLLSGAQVYNMGAPAIGPLGYQYLLREEAVPMAPDRVVVGLFVGNDLVGSVSPPAGPGALRSTFDRQHIAVLEMLRRLRVHREQQDQASMGKATAGRIEQPSGSTKGPGVKTEAEARKRFPFVNDPLLEEPTFSTEAFLEMETRRALQVCRVGLQGYPELYALLLRMRESLAGSPLTLLLIPDEFQVEDQLWKKVQQKSMQPLERDLPQRLLRAWCEEHGFELVDVLPDLREVPAFDDGWRHLYHLRNTHWNARGNAIAGKALAEFLRERL
jgi:hypothetical protein